MRNRWWDLMSAGSAAVTVLDHWRRHEWCSLQGHWRELAERLQLARDSRGVSELIRGQLDLVPESWRRLQRNAETRRTLLAELGGVLRGTASRE